MDNRSWHSDPVFTSFEELEKDLGDSCLVDLSDDNPRADQNNSVPSTAASPQRKRASQNGATRGESSPGLSTIPRASISTSSLITKETRSKSSPGKRDLTLSGRKSKAVYSVKDMDEVVSALKKENFRLKIQVELLERRLNDESTLEQGEEHQQLILLNIAYTVKIQELERDIQLLKESTELNRQTFEQPESHAKELEEAFQAGYSKACNERDQQENFDQKRSRDSAMPPVPEHENNATWNDETYLAEFEAARLQGYNQAMGEIKQVNNNGGRPKTPSRDNVSQTAFIESENIEEARIKGYVQAVEDLKLKGVDLTKPILVDNGTNPDSPASIVQKTDESLMETTEYADFPSNKRLGASSAMSPFKRTLLVGGDSNGPTLSAMKSPASNRKSISALERNTFSLLIGRLQELVEFLSKGLNGSFNFSDASLNVSNVSIMEATIANISLFPEIGSGDGSQASFCLATKLQELIDISRELSFHDVEVETDQQWVFLQEENLKLTAQMEVLEKALNDSKKTAEENGRLSAQIIATEEKFHMQVDQLNAEIRRLTLKLEVSVDSKREYEMELVALNDHISGLETQMAENQANYRFLMENTARRPDCHIGISTDMSMEDIDKDLRESRSEAQQFAGQVIALTGQLENLHTIKTDLEHRLDELNNLMGELETCVKDKQNLEIQIGVIQNQVRQSQQEANNSRLELADVRQLLQDAESRRSDAEKVLTENKTNAELEIHMRDQEIERLKFSLVNMSELRDLVESKLRKSVDELEQMEIRISDLDDMLRRQHNIRAQLEQYIDRPMLTSEQQTELSWPDVKAEKANLCETIERLVAEVEVLEVEMDKVRSASLQNMSAKEDQLQEVLEKINKLAAETDALLDEKDILEQKIADLEGIVNDLEKKLGISEHRRLELETNLENVRERENKLDRWERAVQKEIGKTNTVIKQANRNLSRRTGTETQTQHPLTERAPTQSKTRENH